MLLLVCSPSWHLPPMRGEGSATMKRGTRLGPLCPLQKARGIYPGEGGRGKRGGVCRGSFSAFLQGQKDGFVIKRPYCFIRGPEFRFQHPQERVYKWSVNSSRQNLTHLPRLQRQVHTRTQTLIRFNFNPKLTKML